VRRAEVGIGRRAHRRLRLLLELLVHPRRLRAEAAPVQGGHGGGDRDLDLRAQCIGLQRQGQRTQRGLQLLEGLLAHLVRVRVRVRLRPRLRLRVGVWLRLRLRVGVVAHVAVEAVYDVRGGRDVVHVERVDHLVWVRLRARARGRVRRHRVRGYLPD